MTEDPKPAVPPEAPKLYRLPEPKPFFQSPEFKRILLFGILAVALIGVVVQIEWNKRKLAAEKTKDLEDWQRKQEAVSAKPQSGQATGPGGAVLWDNILATQVDDAPLDDVVSDRGFKYLIRHLANMKPGEDLGAAIPFNYTEFLMNPAQYRGRVVSLSGLMNKVYPNIRLESNQGDFDSVYRLYIVHLSGTEGFVVDVLDRPDGLDRRDPIECKAIYVRTHSYENEKGQKVRVPYFVARGVKELDRGTVTRTWTKGTTITISSVCAALVIIIVLAGRQRRPKAPVKSAA